MFLDVQRDGGFDAVDTMIAALCLRATASILAKREVFLMLIADLMILCLTAGNAHGHHHPFGFPHHATESPKTFNPILGTAVLYVSCSIVAVAYNLLYRWVIPRESDVVAVCSVSNVVEEIVITVTRSVLLMFYVIMLSKVFAEIPDYFIKSAFAFIVVVHMALLPAFYIATEEHTGYDTPHFGIYCRDESKTPTAKTAAAMYHVVDFLMTAAFCGTFVVKLKGHLYALESKEEDGDYEDAEREHNENAEREHNALQNKAMTTVLRLAKKATALCLVSSLSSWLIIFGGRIDSESETFLRWIYPLDYVVNAWCAVLFFDWGQELKCILYCFDRSAVEVKVEGDPETKAGETRPAEKEVE